MSRRDISPKAGRGRLGRVSDLMVRPAEPGESDAIAAVYGRSRAAASMPPGLHTAEEDRGWFGARLRDGVHDVWVAQRGDQQDGVLLGYALATATWLDHLFVDPDAQGTGVGAALLDTVKAVRPGGFCLWVFESNTPARSFYARRGLVELERTDGSGNEERSPDVKMAWPGGDPVTFFRRLIDEVDDGLGDLLARRVALTRAVQHAKSDPARDPVREREIAERLASRAPELGADRLGRIVDTIVTESLDAVRR
jgi:chorismate mutase/ribosomal protein S18 acetylase RimI-like enzyme